MRKWRNFSRGRSPLALLALLALLWGLSVTPLCAAAPAGPVADNPLRAFNQHHKRGAELYKAGDYAAAIVELTAAYEIKQLPRLLYNIAQAHRRLGHTQEALRGFELYLTGDPDLTDADRAEVQKIIQGLRALDPGNLGAEAGRSARGADEPTPAGPERAAESAGGTAAGAGQTGAGHAGAGQTGAGQTGVGQAGARSPGAAGSASLAGSSLGRGATPRRRVVIAKREAPRYMTAGLWSGVGVTGALAVGAAVLGGLALSASGALGATQYPTSADFLDQQGRVRGLGIGADIALGGAVVAGVVTLAVGLSRRAAAPRIALLAGDDPGPRSLLGVTW